MENPRPTCDTCNHTSQGPIPNRYGGWFFLCRKCNRTWDLNGTPNPFSRPGFSYRDRVKAALTAEGLEPDAMLREFGLPGCAKLVGIKIPV